MIVQWDEDEAAEYPKLDKFDPSPNGGTFEAIIPKDVCRQIPKMAAKWKKAPKPILRNIAFDEHAFSKNGNAVQVAATDIEHDELISARCSMGDTLQFTMPFQYQMMTP